uniref:Transcription factor GTE7-like n=1 Tax=Davidia involucrata TaxID=16924 RepID=A0A5B6ZK49_DAVIN
MKMCRQVLTKLMKNKHSWIFNTPVDAAALGLHDYHQIIKHPMDLGTVKSNFTKNLYRAPIDFAADVRLTFNNAMLYNPKGDEVYVMAEQLLARFEDLFRPINAKFGGERKKEKVIADELQGSSWNHIPTPERAKKPKPNPMPPISKKHERIQNTSSSSNPPPLNPQSAQSPVPTPSPMQAPPVKPLVMKTNLVKLPKPKAKDPNKREMSMEEKQKLGLGLQSLPPEKMPQLVQIIRKKNEHLAQEGDEIELDIEAIDTETLWELDRFVTNWKKMVSKTKRQALMGNNLAAATATATDLAEADELHVMSEKTETMKKPKKGDAGEEDVDIGDEMPMSSFPPVEIEKDDGGQDHGHVTSSSSSSSSSSSDSSSSSGIETSILIFLQFVSPGMR